MGNSEWDMLTMLSNQHKQLKNAQQLSHHPVNFEHARKMQGAPHLSTENSVISQSQRPQGAQPGKQGPGGVIKQEAFNRANFNQI